MSAASHTAPVTFVTARDDAQQTATLWVVGELDDFTVDAFEAELARLVPISRALIIELSSCTFISSVALAALMRLRRRLPDHPVALVTDSAHMRKLIRITGLEPLFPRFENVVDALVAVSGSNPWAHTGSTADRGTGVKLPLGNGSGRALRIVRET